MRVNGVNNVAQGAAPRDAACIAAPRGAARGRRPAAPRAARRDALRGAARLGATSRGAPQQGVTPRTKVQRDPARICVAGREDSRRDAVLRTLAQHNSRFLHDAHHLSELHRPV